MKKLKYIKTLALFMLTVALFSSCTEKIDVELDESYTRLVVDGSITTDTMAHTIRLVETADYFANQPATPVTGAEIKINDGTGSIQLIEDKPGIYKTAPDYFAEAGKTYHLTINLQSEVGGHTSYEASETVNPIAEMDSIGFKYWPNLGDGYWEVKCYVLDPPTTEFYMFDSYINDKLVTDTITERMVVDDILYNGSYTNGIGVAWLDQELPTEKAGKGDKITIRASSISEGYANFLWELTDETEGNNPLFDGPPANIKGNISNGAIGYFAAYSVDYESRVIGDEKKQ
ncbi:MAG: DUF4249 domain-containing protein [Bacteroidales bacterium]|nr:DUF4249 domain-containing protein [Bacteroidales bacterium]